MEVSDTLPRWRRMLRPCTRPCARLCLPAWLLLLSAAILAGSRAESGHGTILLAIGLVSVLALRRGGGQPPANGAGADSRTGPALLRAITAPDGTPDGGPDSGRQAGRQAGRCAACMVIRLDDFQRIREAHGRCRQIEVLHHLARRIDSRFHPVPPPFYLSDDAIALVIPLASRPAGETLDDLAARLQAAIAEPVQIDGSRLQVTASIGYCADRDAPGRSGRALLDAAQFAADEACGRAPGGSCAYSPGMAGAQGARGLRRDRLAAALARGEIRPHFQPQISTDTGALSGLEALARWHHPERGLLGPAEFLPAIARLDLSGRLGEVMLHEALAALAQWDRAGLRVPSVSVNFSADELRNPWLPERIRWELDRHGLRPPRLTVEILETVVAAAENDLLLSNIAQLSSMGCGIDLDDFGTGHASIWTIRRFQVRRLKIDRYFVAGADHSHDQQQMVSAILSLAERLQLDTVAEGIETPGEHALLSQLGCGHVQGFGIARPMPFGDATTWIAGHHARPEPIPRIGSSSG